MLLVHHLSYLILLLSLVVSDSKMLPFRRIATKSYGLTKSHCRRFMSSVSESNIVDTYNTHVKFMKESAKVDPVPSRLLVLLQLLQMQSGEQPLKNSYSRIIPTPISARKGINPFLIPVAENVEEKSLLCYIRWPTQKENMDLQLVRASSDGMITLVSLSTDQYCHRLAVEMDFYGHPKAAAAAGLLSSSEGSQISYNIGDYLPLLKSGKFPAITQNDLRLVLDRFLLTKVGAFPDCYERLAEDFLARDNAVSALVTCERASSVFYGWGHPIAFHSGILQGLPERQKEAKDTARAAMSMPKWTLAPDRERLQQAVIRAGFSDCAILGDLHAFRAKDLRTKDVEEGLSPIQVTLDQAAHLMDAVALGTSAGKTTIAAEGSANIAADDYFRNWEAARSELANKYREGGYPEMADFILCV